MSEFVARLKRLVRPESPERDLGITFRVLPPAPDESAPELDHVNTALKDAGQVDSLEYLKACIKEARKLSRCNLSVAKRMPLTEDFVKYFLPVAFKHIRAHTNDGGVPDSERRQDILEAIIQVVVLLTESYKIVFKKSYLGGGHALFGSTNHVELSAFRILELIKLQQRVRGLRYQLLFDSAWLVANTVFHVMHAAGQADTPMPTLEHIATEETVARTQTIREMFLAIQMISKFDILRWPTEWQAHLFDYTREAGALVRSVEDDGGDLPRDTSISYCYASRPARRKRAAADANEGPGLLIDWTKLTRQVTGHFVVLFNERNLGDRTKIPRELTSLSHNEALAFVQLQFECITTVTPQTAADGGTGAACDMRLFIGFRSVYQLLRNIHGGLYGVGNRLDDFLAKRSAVFAEDDVATTESVWFLQFQDDEMIRLRTQETKFTTAMRIGFLAAYGIGTEGIAKPSFGVISRIFRSSEKSVTVDILKRGEHVEPVVASTDLDAFANKDKNKAGLLGGIIVKDKLGETSLLLPPVNRPRGKNELVMKRAQAVQTITLGKLQSITKDFLMFRFGGTPSEDAHP